MANKSKEIKVKIKADYKDSFLKPLEEINNAIKGMNSNLGNVDGSGLDKVGKKAKKAKQDIQNELGEKITVDVETKVKTGNTNGLKAGMDEATNAGKKAGEEFDKAGEKAKGAGDKTEGAGKRGASGLKRSQESAKSLTQSLSEVTIVAAGIVTVVEKLKDGIAALVLPGYKFNKQMESMELGVAGIIMSMMNLHGSTLTLNQALGVSKEVMGELKDTAMKIGLPMDSMVEGFQAMLGPGLRAKMTIQQIVELTGTGMKAVKAFGLDNRQIAQEMRDMFSGQITVDSQMAKALNISSGDIDRAKESVGGLYAYLKEKFKGMEVIAKAYPDTLNGAMEQLKNTVILGSGEALEGFNNKLKGVVNELFNYIADANKETGKITLKPEVKQAFTDVGDAVLKIIQALGKIGIALGPSLITAIKAVAAALSIIADYAKNIVMYFTAMYTIRGLAAVIGPVTAAVMALYKAWKLAGVAMAMVAGAEAAANIGIATAALGKMKQAVIALTAVLGKMNKKNILLAVLALGMAAGGDKLFDKLEELIGRVTGGNKASGEGTENTGEDIRDSSDAGLRNRNAETKVTANDLTTNADITKDSWERVKQNYDTALANLEGDIKSKMAQAKADLDALEGKYALGQASKEEYLKQKAQLEMQSASLKKDLVQAQIDHANGLADAAVPYKTPAEVQNMRDEATKLAPELEEATNSLNAFRGAVEAMGAVAVGAGAEGNTWRRETGNVDIEGLNDNAKQAINALSAYFMQLTGKQMVVSSGLRTGGGAGGHVSGYKFDVVDDADSRILEDNLDGIRDKILDFAHKLGIARTDRADGLASDEYRFPSPGATAGHLDFDAANFDSTAAASSKFATMRATGFANAKFAEFLDAVEANWKTEMTVHAERLRAEGKNRDAANLEIDLQYYDQEKELTKNKQYAALQELGKTKQLKKARAEIDQTFTDIENAKSKFSNDLQSIAMYELNPQQYMNNFAPIYEEFNNATAAGLKSAMELNEKVLKDPALREKIRAAMKENLTTGYETLSKAVGVVNDNLSLQEANINNFYSLNGGDSITQARELLAVRKETAGVMLNTLIPALEKYAELTKDPALVIAAQKMRQEWQYVADSIDPLQQSFRDAAKSGLQEFFETGIQECKNLTDAFRSLVKSVLTELNKLNAKRLAEALNGSVGDFFYNITGNGSGGGGSSNVQGPRKADGSFAEGGHVMGAGTETSDSILARLSRGEFVVKAASVRRVGLGFLNAVNRGFVPNIKMPRFAVGGLVGAAGAQSYVSNIGGPNVGVKVVNVTDPNEVGRYLNSRPGEQVMVNWIKRNAATVRQILRK